MWSAFFERKEEKRKIKKARRLRGRTVCGQLFFNAFFERKEEKDGGESN